MSVWVSEPPLIIRVSVLILAGKWVLVSAYVLVLAHLYPLAYLQAIHYLNSGIKFMKWNASIVAQHLTTNIFTNGCCSVKLQQQICAQDVLGTVHFEICHVGAQPHPLRLEIEHELLET